MSVLKLQDDLFEGFLDNDRKVYDYGTAAFDGVHPFDIHHTGVSYYDDFLNSSTVKKLQERNNLTGKIVMMTPEEYYRDCATHIFNSSVEKLKTGRGVHDRKIIDHLLNVLTVYKRQLCLPMINYAAVGQEGLHRMYAVGELLGWNIKVPVLVVDWYDKERADNEHKAEKQAKIDRKVNAAIDRALEYHYADVQEIEDQLCWELERSFQYDENIKVPSTIKLEKKHNNYIFNFLNHEYEMDEDKIQFKSIEDQLDIEDIDLEETEDFLKRYFGDDWKETNPDLKDRFNID